MIPEGWKNTKLGDYCKVQGGFAFKSKDFINYGVPVIRISNIKSGSIDLTNNTTFLPDIYLQINPNFVVKNGDILMALSGATTGKFGMNQFETPALLNQRVGRFNVLNKQELHEGYLYQILNGISVQVIEQAYGAAQPNISPKDLEGFSLLLPPLPEQKKIATILSSVDDTIQATQAVIEQIRRVKQGLLLQLLTRGIGHTRFKQTEIGEIPYGWEICDLAQVANVIDCKHRTPKYTDQGYPVIRPRDVKEGILEFSGCLRIPQDEYEDLIENHCPLSGDVVYSRNATFGIASIVDTDRPFAIGQDVCIITGIHMCGEILFYLLNSRVVRKQLDSLSAGSTFKRINLKDIRRFKVPLIPKAEQGEIVAIADSLSEYLRATNLELDQLIQTKRGLMQDLLTGRVRVNCAE